MSKAKKPALKVVSAPRTDDDFDRLYAITRDAERLIDAGIFLPKPPDWMCVGCAYGKACREVYAGKVA